MMPGRAAGMRTWMIVSARVAPRPNEASRSDLGTAEIASSASEDTNGMIMMPMTRPAASALSEDTSRPIVSPSRRISGATVRAAKKP